MMLTNIPDCILNSVQIRVLTVDYFNRSQVDYFSLAPRHHELRHLVLGDFGRTALSAKHSPTFNSDDILKNNADRETQSAGKEAIDNASH
jgi:hypothetical protein